MNQFENQVAVVTGASRGIGRAIAATLGQSGATVVGTATTQEGAERIQAFFQEQGIQGAGAVLNVTDDQSIADFHQFVTQSFEVPSILVNNAGITRDGLLMRMKEQDWDDVIQTNLSAVFRLTQRFLKSMVKARYGRIINVASVVAATGNPGQSNYAAAKAGLIGFSKSLAQEVGSRGVTVNVVAPGFIETDMTAALNDEQKQRFFQHIPVARFGQSEEIAHAVAYFASKQAGYVTGETLHVNGGLYMS